MSEPQALEKITQICRALLGVKYGGLPLERFEDDSLEQALDKLATKDEFSHTFSQLDCVTFVETVMAAFVCASPTPSQDEILEQLKNIRYEKAPYSFMHRNHFLSRDWLPHNQTHLEPWMQPLAVPLEQATAMIEKGNWLCHHPVLEPFRQDENFTGIVHAWLEKNYPAWVSAEVTVDYLPLELVIEHFDKIKDALPATALMTIVRPNLDLKEKAGSALLMSHLGFALRADQNIHFYHATSDPPLTVVGANLLDYLHFCTTLKPTVSGVQFYRVHQGAQDGRQ